MQSSSFMTKWVLFNSLDFVHTKAKNNRIKPNLPNLHQSREKFHTNEQAGNQIDT